jgi:hypothetical protein
MGMNGGGCFGFAGFQEPRAQVGMMGLCNLRHRQEIPHDILCRRLNALQSFRRNGDAILVFLVPRRRISIRADAGGLP